MSSQFWGRHIEPTLLKFGRLIHLRNGLNEFAVKKNAIVLNSVVERGRGLQSWSQVLLK